MTTLNDVVFVAFTISADHVGELGDRHDRPSSTGPRLQTAPFDATSASMSAMEVSAALRALASSRGDHRRHRHARGLHLVTFRLEARSRTRENIERALHGARSVHALDRDAGGDRCARERRARRSSRCSSQPSAPPHSKALDHPTRGSEGWDGARRSRVRRENRGERDRALRTHPADVRDRHGRTMLCVHKRRQSALARTLGLRGHALAHVAQPHAAPQQELRPRQRREQPQRVVRERERHCRVLLHAEQREHHHRRTLA